MYVCTCLNLVIVLIATCTATTLAYTQAQLSIYEDVIPKFLIGSSGGKLNKNHVFHLLMIVFQVVPKNPLSQVQEITIPL